MLECHGPWKFVPFDNITERSDLKRLFETCAGKETEGLKMTGGKRKYGIPTLVVIDCESEEIVTVNGVEGVMEGGKDSAAVIQGW
eukprot:CAMPEP_0195525260 /NCGR_PEP_ID=MMETSP0794_2-20130614/25614_1 /TAXON_ID=515487 /ORGANISM="Stephanopyxis turris, Strain CCMP 815" /LENGTH=84 /DNA_ID=CAMNT_0040655679 /DNA_START=305 /DNA_END=556 /DNA_ORIENTATION=-